MWLLFVYICALFVGTVNNWEKCYDGRSFFNNSPYRLHNLELIVGKGNSKRPVVFDKLICLGSYRTGMNKIG